MTELSESVRELQMAPILVRPLRPEEIPTKSKAKYQIVDGQRRWEALRTIGAVKIRVIVVHPKDILEQHRMSLIANLHRAEHSNYEYALAVLFQSRGGRTPTQIALDFSKSITWVYGFLRLGVLVQPLFERLNPAVDRNQKLSMSICQILAGVKQEKQEAILLQAQKEGAAHGPRGIKMRLLELAKEKENASDVLPCGRHKPDLHDHSKKVRAGLSTIMFKAREIRGLAGEFRRSILAEAPESRREIANGLGEAIKDLQKFSEILLVPDVNS